MESITDLAPEIQKRISDFEYFLDKEGMKRPEVKFTGTILTLQRHLCIIIDFFLSMR